MLSVGIIGLPNAGKSTLFNALLGRQLAQVATHPFTTIEPNVGVVSLADERLDLLFEMVKKVEKGEVKKVPATIKFIDIAGLVKGAHKGEGLGNQFLSHIREVDCLCFVLRDFEDENVSRVGSDPKQDFETLKMELILKDLETLERLKKEKSEDQNLLDKLIKSLSDGLMVGQLELDDEEREIVKQWFLLTNKPYFIVLNVSESDLSETEKKVKDFKDWAVVVVSAKLEEQLWQLSEKERQEYLESFGLKKSGLERLVKTAFDHLGLITFYTVKGGREISSWPLKKGSTAIEAAAIIHSDFAKKFVKAEVIDWQKLLEAGSWMAASQKGWLQLHGRDYEIKEGQVVEFKLGN